MKYGSNYEEDKNSNPVITFIKSINKKIDKRILFVGLAGFVVILITAVVVLSINSKAKHSDNETVSSVSSESVSSDTLIDGVTEISEHKELMYAEVINITISSNNAGYDGECGVDMDALFLSAGALSDNEFDKYEEGGEVDLYSLGDEYAKLAIANVESYVNVRSEANTESEIVGYIYNGSVGSVEEIVDGENGKWFKISSGNVTGYIKSEFFISGNDAAEVAHDYVTTYATVLCDRLNVREKATTDSNRIGYVEANEKLVVKAEEDGWYKVVYSENKLGYVSAEFVSTSEEFIYARTIEEDNAIKEEARKQLEREQQAKNQKIQEQLTFVDTSVPPASTYSTNSELRNAIIATAMQYLGNRYVLGGSTLEGGTDCSGFTSLIYARYGYSLSRTTTGQLSSNGRYVDYSQAQPGDIICYSGNGRTCTHVALYIGNGQIIHSSTPRRGVIIGTVTSCGQILGIKNVID